MPRGQISEIVGPRSSGRTSITLQLLAAATARGELVALVDALDMLDVDSAAAAGVDLERLLWVRGHVVSNPGMCRDMNQRALEQTIRALALILQAGNFGLIVFDAAEAPPDALRRLPFTTWLRLQRMVEGSQTTCVLVGSETMARSSAGLTLRTGIRDWGLGDSVRTSIVRRTEHPHARRSSAGAGERGGDRGIRHGVRPTVRELFAALYRPPQADAPAVSMTAIAGDFSPRYERHGDDLVSIDVSGLQRLLKVKEGARADDRRGARARRRVARCSRPRRGRRHAHGGRGDRAGNAGRHGRVAG